MLSNNGGTMSLAHHIAQNWGLYLCVFLFWFKLGTDYELMLIHMGQWSWLECNCSTVNVMEKCGIDIRTKNYFVETVSNAFCVPNILEPSASNFWKRLCDNYSKRCLWNIYDPSRGAIVIQMDSNRLFPMKIDASQSCLMAEVKDTSWLWHFHYSHLNFSRLKTLQLKNMTSDLHPIGIPS